MEKNETDAGMLDRAGACFALPADPGERFLAGPSAGGIATRMGFTEPEHSIPRTPVGAVVRAAYDMPEHPDDGAA